MKDQYDFVRPVKYAEFFIIMAIFALAIWSMQKRITELENQIDQLDRREQIR